MATGKPPCLFQGQCAERRGQRSPLGAEWQREADCCQSCVQLPQPPPLQGSSSSGQWIGGFTTDRIVEMVFKSALPTALLQP